jgi:hypothetical protein
MSSGEEQLHLIREKVAHSHMEKMMFKGTSVNLGEKHKLPWGK